MAIVKRMCLGDKAREKLKEGIDLAVDYVKISLGPCGRNVALKQMGPMPTRVANDGKTIADNVRSDDPLVQAGVEMLQEICRKTDMNAGDGTTQTAVLTQVLVQEAIKRVAGGINPVVVERELKTDLRALMKELKAISIPVITSEHVRSVATIAGNNDEEIGNAIAEVMEKVGLNASLKIKKGNEEAIKVQATKGIWFDKGYKAPVFINDIARREAVYENPVIFLVDGELNYNDQIMDFLQAFADNYFDKNEKGEKLVFRRGIVIIAREISGALLESLAKTHFEKMNVDLNEGLYFLPIEAPFAGPDQSDCLDDIALYTGGKVIKETELNKINPVEYMGTCDEITATSQETTIIGGKGDEKLIAERIAVIKKSISELDSSEKTIKEKLENRRDILESGVGLIYAGGPTEIEVKQRYLRLEDAVRAAKAAVAEGFVAGGGFTYLLLEKVCKSDIVKAALRATIKQVALNSGESPEEILTKCLNSDLTRGWNAKTGEMCDLITEGIVDATLVIKNALTNSISLTCQFITTEALICEEDVDKYKEKK